MPVLGSKHPLLLQGRDLSVCLLAGRNLPPNHSSMVDNNMQHYQQQSFDHQCTPTPTDQGLLPLRIWLILIGRAHRGCMVRLLSWLVLKPRFRLPFCHVPTTAITIIPSPATIRTVTSGSGYLLLTVGDWVSVTDDGCRDTCPVLYILLIKQSKHCFSQVETGPLVRQHDSSSIVVLRFFCSSVC